LNGRWPHRAARRALAAHWARLAHLPTTTEALQFLAHLRRPTRVSAVRALVDGVVVAVTLQRRGVRPLMAPGITGTSDPDRSMRVAAAVDAGLAMIPVAPTCLRRSLTLTRELHRLGLAATLHIGVRNVAGQTQAHAWVQAGTVIVNDDPEVTRTYVELVAGELERLLPLLR
jgi:hypothetical protein